MSENSRGCWARARAKVEPALTSARSAATRWCWRGSSASSDRAARARSMGRPDPTSPAIWRVHTVSPVEPRTGRVSQREAPPCGPDADRKSTRLNSSHSQISYAVFCLKKKKKKQKQGLAQYNDAKTPEHSGA